MENIKIKDHFIKSLNGMALGLFSSLLILLIIKQLGLLLEIELLVQFGNIAQLLMGPAISAGVAYSLDAPPLGVFASVIVGAIGAGTIQIEGNTSTIVIGEPVGAYVASMVGVIASKLVNRNNSFKILVIPFTTIIIGG